MPICSAVVLAQPFVRPSYSFPAQAKNSRTAAPPIAVPLAIKNDLSKAPHSPATSNPSAETAPLHAERASKQATTAANPTYATRVRLLSSARAIPASRMLRSVRLWLLRTKVPVPDIISILHASVVAGWLGCRLVGSWHPNVRREVAKVFPSDIADRSKLGRVVDRFVLGNQLLKQLAWVHAF